jgi:hypothetical protein
VNELVAALQDARIRKQIASGTTDLATFGLAPAACTVRLDLGAKAPASTVRIGRNSPVGSERYAATDDGRIVFTDASLYSAVSRGAETFREKRLVPLESADVARISLRRPSELLTLSMKDGACRVLAPVVDAGLSAACEDLARAVTSVELAEPFAPRPSVDGDDKHTIRIEVEPKGGKSPIVAFIAATGIGGRRLAFRDGAKLAGLVDDSAARELERPADSFRDSHVVSFSTPDVRGLTLSRGPTVLRIVRAGEASPWTGTEGTSKIPVDATKVATLLDSLRGLTASGFGAATSATEPAATITVSGEHAELARLTFGADWITTPARPGTVFRVEANSLSAFPKTAGDLH